MANLGVLLRVGVQCQLGPHAFTYCSKHWGGHSLLYDYGDARCFGFGGLIIACITMGNLVMAVIVAVRAM